MTDMSEVEAIPVIDFSSIAVTKSEQDITDNDLRHVGDQLVKALTNVGFCYMTNHGIDGEFLQECLENAKRFFALPVEVKKRFLRVKGDTKYTGWLPGPQVEGLPDRQYEQTDPTKPADKKEVHNLKRDLEMYPTEEELPGFRDATYRLMDIMDALLFRSCHALGLALKFDNPKVVFDLMKDLGTDLNDSCLRYAFYPKNDALKEGETRCFPHTDFGILTFLFDNGVRGLQVHTRAGTYIDVPSQKGKGDIILNVGDTMERLTGGILHSAMHKVIVDPETAAVDRYSVIYFPISDKHAMVHPLCGEKHKYKAMTTQEFINLRVVETYLSSS